jgi:cytochrome c peroxidase
MRDDRMAGCSSAMRGSARAALRFAVSCLAACVFGCARQPSEPTCALAIEPLADPPHFPARNDSKNNPTTDLGRALGRRLFFDPRLSKDGRVSCASCHDPEHAFSIAEALPTRGISGRPLRRHAPTLLNLAWANSGLFWDGGATNLESQALGPLLDKDEMGRADSLAELVRELARDPTYAVCFDAVFGPAGLSVGNLARAIAQFERGIVSATSRWDLSVRGALNLTERERAGQALFERACARCHEPPLFTDGGFHNNGLDSTFPSKPDAERRGRARISRAGADLGKYKTPTLREVARSAPYMHDGRFATLSAVIEHYRHGMLSSATLDPGFTCGASPGVSMSDREADELQAFLESL